MPNNFCTDALHNYDLSTSFFFFFNDTATTEIYTLSLHDALPICRSWTSSRDAPAVAGWATRPPRGRSEEHTSELQSRQYLVCRLLLEKKKKKAYVHENLTRTKLRDERA